MSTTAGPGVVAILGGGVMGETVLAGVLEAGYAPSAVVVVERRAERVDELRERYGMRAGELADAVPDAKVVVLVVKPQDAPALAVDLAPLLRPGALVVSLAAGITTASLEAALPAGTPVARVMPNTPARVGQGMAVLSAGAHCTEEHLALAESLLEGASRTARVPEALQDAVTAVSGSGPAYLFAVAEAMVAVAVDLGLPRETAGELVGQTLLGAATMLRETGEEPAELRRQVSSPKGTTVAALEQLEAHGLAAAFAAAMTAARDRSRELSGG